MKVIVKILSKQNKNNKRNKILVLFKYLEIEHTIMKGHYR